MERGGGKLKITHLDDEGNINMVDVSKKKTTTRTAVAKGSIAFPKKIAEELKKNPQSKKGNILNVAKLGGINAAKKTSDLVLLCHQINLKNVEIEIKWDKSSLTVISKVVTKSETGVEIEAINAVMIALLNIYDMTKSLTKEIEIDNIRLVEKTK